jgi:hypothetical membrane protein
MQTGIFRIFGFSGTGLVTLVIICSALFYHGRQGECFSLRNHFISELGEVGISRAAWLFNLGLILSGLILLPYIISLGFVFTSPLGWLGTVLGLVAALAVSAVGIFPMNNLTSHSRAAMTYFRSGLVMIFFFGLAILFQPAGKQTIPQAANIFSLFAFAAYGAFLLRVSLKKTDQQSADTPDMQPEWERSPVSITACLEWAVFFSTILWLFGMALLI